VLSVFGRRIKGMIRLRQEQVWTCNVTLHVQTCSRRNRTIPLMRRPNTDSTPNKPVTLPRNQLLIRYAVTSPVHTVTIRCYDTRWRYKCMPTFLLQCVTSLGVLYFSATSQKRHVFLKLDIIEHKLFVLIFSTTIVWNISHSKKNSARYYHKCAKAVMLNTHYPCQILKKREFFLSDIWKNSSDIIVHENAFSLNRVVPCRQTDRQTDRHYETNSRLSQICERVSKQIKGCYLLVWILVMWLWIKDNFFGFFENSFQKLQELSS
jgi:hypothetical protein